MKTIGLLGGMSWESSQGYYRLINEGVKAALGGLHSARIVMISVDFAPIAEKQAEDDWDGLAYILSDAAQCIERGGADCLLICTNTMHKVAPEVEAAVGIPLLHIADATAAVLAEQGVKTVGLLGNAFTMEQDFYKGRLAERFGLEVLTPGADDRALVHRVIFEELCLGEFKPESKAEYLRIVEALAAAGAEAVILGCTEIGMLIEQADTEVPLLDTTAIHADAAVRFATN